MLKYSIIIPTYNNSEKLKKCLAYIQHLKKPLEDFEVIVIDNGSTDETSKIVRRYDFVKYFYDSTPGLHTGRHLGAKKALGQILCFIDDDSFVDKNWLIEIEKTFLKEEVVLAGGNNLPLYETNPPHWLKYFWIKTPYGKYMDKLSLINFKNKQMKVPAWFVFGCNFIIKKDILLELGGFNPDGMPQSLIKYRGDGETAISCKLNKKGLVAHFYPKIKIHHFVPKSRMTLEYLKRRAFNGGVSHSYSKIRKENGFNYFDFEPNINVDKVSLSLLEKLHLKLSKCLNFLNNFNPNYKYYQKIKEEIKEAEKQGFEYHQEETQKDEKLLSWVLQDNYFN